MHGEKLPCLRPPAWLMCWSLLHHRACIALVLVLMATPPCGSHGSWSNAGATAAFACRLKAPMQHEGFNVSRDGLTDREWLFHVAASASLTCQTASVMAAC